MLPAGCGNTGQSGDFVAPPKEATKRQKEMFDFMKERGKAKEPRKAGAEGTTKAPG